jgi:predicted DNA-binding transcriptional regulator AlpA
MEDYEDLRLIRIGRLLELIPVSKVSLYRMIKVGDFPAPEKLGGCSVWSYDEIKRWKDKRFPVALPRRREIDDLV